jgi:hypothetical protein
MKDFKKNNIYNVMVMIGTGFRLIIILTITAVTLIILNAVAYPMIENTAGRVLATTCISMLIPILVILVFKLTGVIDLTSNVSSINIKMSRPLTWK